MKSKLKNINSYTKEIAIDVPWGDLQENFLNTFKDFKKGYSIPGFRKGRVPDNIVKRNYGPAIEADFTEKSINKYYQLALQELKLFPIRKM